MYLIHLLNIYQHKDHTVDSITTADHQSAHVGSHGLYPYTHNPEKRKTKNEKENQPPVRFPLSNR